MILKIVSSARKITNFNMQQLRLGHHMRGKPPTVARSLKERLDELNYKDELYTTRIDIGFPQRRKGRDEALLRSEHIRKQKNDKDFERLARSQALNVDIDKVREDWLSTIGPHHKKQIAEHYGIFEHLYNEGYFIPYLNLDISFDQENDIIIPVYNGNVIKPNEAVKTPIVEFKSDSDSLWTLVLTSLDGHLKVENKEYIHWFVSNIPGNDVSKGNLIVDYMRPIPPKGTGFHRYVFVLYKQNGKIDYNLNKITGSSSLDDRTFVTREWYAKYQDNITPAGLAFFQSDWDQSLTDFYHNVLNMKEPSYEYDFPQPYYKQQKWFPLREAFDLYLDRYRDPKQINKEYLVRKLKDVHPFKKPDPPLKYPNAQPFPRGMPSWLKLHEKKYRMGWGRVNEIKES